MPSAERLWGGKTRDERRDERRIQVLEAATDIVGTAGVAALTTRAVSQRTGLIQRYIYESFDSRDDLLRAVFDTQLERVLDSLQSAYAEAPSDDVLDKMATAFRVTVLTLMQSDPRIVKILAVEPTADQALLDRMDVTFKALEGLVADLILSESNSSLNPAQHAFVAKALVGGSLTVFRAWAHGNLPLTAEEFVETAVWSISSSPWVRRG
ncbi:TetR/AcrR family transcriptional regulator [Mycobacteriaceae bacterium NPDC060252]